MFRIVGITGGIGVGKSFILRQIEQAGYPTYSADVRAKQLMEKDDFLREAIKAEFGPAAYTDGGELNRAYLAAAIFSEPKKRERLNALVHPRTFADFASWLQEREREGHPAVFKEAALTLEAGAQAGVTDLVMVYAPLKVRMRRICERDHSDEGAALSRIRSQWPEWQKIAYADFVIVNDGILPILPQLEALFSRLHLPFPR
ncbi:MAG: dephospho-CoA kinase [Bacteroidia bacterium]|nr:dephospho-CoA kinase [Bacteroidia bacterium]